MYTKHPPFCWLQVFLTVAVVVAVGMPKFASGEDSAPTAADNTVLATVNGTPITQADVQLAVKRGSGHGVQATPQNEQQALEDIIEQELAYQRAVADGLHQDVQYQQQLAKIEAQLNAFKRQKLSAAFLQQLVEKRSVVSAEEAQHYFDANTAQLRTELHIWQILRRDAKSIGQVEKDLANAIPFETVAAKGMPKLPSTLRKPWDLGYLRWSQIPEAWREEIQQLDVGGNSQIIRGLNNRFWIIRLIDKRENPALQFADVKPQVTQILRREKQQRLQKLMRQELREAAHIIYSPQRAAGRD